MAFKDSTDDKTYFKVAVYQGTGSTYTWYTNRTAGDSDNDQYERGVSFISVTEIAG